MVQDIAMNTEPVAIATAVSFAIKAILLAIMAFGGAMTRDQLAAVMVAVDAVLGVILVLVVRPQVVPLGRAKSQIATAVRMPSNTRVSEVIAKEKRDNP